MIEIDKIKKKLEQLSFLNLNIFQIKNLSMAVAAAKLCNLKEKKIFNSLKDLKDVSGRLELIRTIPNNIKIYIDYAHSPDALLNVLKALIKKHGKHISLVFGCGGDRDFKKRPLMAKIASKYCKKIYVTDDNPRNENPKKIRNEIFKNIKNCFCLNIGNRSKAIKKAVYDAEPNDIILVAGKGHETNQIYKNKKISISDKQVIKNLKLRKNVTKKYQNFYQNKKILNDIKKVNKIQNFHGIQIDSRLVEKNNLFLTIKGKNNDGKILYPMLLKKAQNILFPQK